MAGETNPRTAEADPHLQSDRLSDLPTPELIFDRIERHSPDDPYAQASNLILLTGLSARVNSAQEVSGAPEPRTVLEVDGQDMHIAILLRMHKAGELLYEPGFAAEPQVIAYEHFLKESRANHRQFLGDLSLAALDLLQRHAGEEAAQLRIFGMNRFLCDKSERFFLQSMHRHFELPGSGILNDFDPLIVRAFWDTKSFWEAKYALRSDAPTSTDSTARFTDNIQAALDELPRVIDLR